MKGLTYQWTGLTYQWTPIKYPANIYFLELTIETLEKGVKYVQS